MWFSWIRQTISDCKGPGFTFHYRIQGGDIRVSSFKIVKILAFSE